MQRIEAERHRTVQRSLLMHKGEYAAIREHSELSKPLAGGATHSHPEQEEQMHRDYDRRAYSTLGEMEKYDLHTRALNEAAVAAIKREMSAHKAIESPAADDVAQRDPRAAKKKRDSTCRPDALSGVEPQKVRVLVSCVSRSRGCVHGNKLFF